MNYFAKEGAVEAFVADITRLTERQRKRDESAYNKALKTIGQERFVIPAVLDVDPANMELKTNLGAMGYIVDEVCRIYGITKISLMSARRGRKVAWPRQIAMWLCVQKTACSYPAIGRYFGGRDHTTVMHAEKVVDQVLRQMGQG